MPITKKRIAALSDHDIAALLQRGVSAQAAIRNGLFTDPWWRISQSPALDIPYFTLEGKSTGLSMKRPHEPRTVDGRALKYEWAPGESPLGYFPAQSRMALVNGSSDIFITEGPLKAIALTEYGYTVIGINGVWGWKVKGEEELLPSLQGYSGNKNNSGRRSRITWEGRRVYLVPDFDPKPETRSHVLGAMKRLAALLRQQGVDEVLLVQLPPAANGGKQGVDDFLVANKGAA